MNLLLKNEQSEISEDQLVTCFKKEYREFIIRHEMPQFESLLSTVEIIFDVTLTSFLKDKLHIWFQNVAECRFLLNFITQVEFNEVIFHNSSKIQVDNGEVLECYTHEGLNEEDYQLALETLALKNHIAWNYTHPFVSFSLELEGHHFRATFTHLVLSPFKHSKVFLRRAHQKKIRLEDFGLHAHTCEQLRAMIKDKKNILISGSTGSGKTTFTRALLAEIPEDEHIVILEDTHEIPALHDGYTHLIASANPGADLKSFCAYAMRMRPDRIILGEMRSYEVIPFLLAMNTGHKGLMSTLHANSASDAIKRVAQLFCLYQGGEMSYPLVLKLVSTNVDVVIHLKKKKVAEIIEVMGSEEERVYFNQLATNE